MQRADALAIVDELVQSPNIRKHCLAVEAFMRGLARYFGEDEEEWGIVGLLHDADYEATEKDLERHTDLTVERAVARGANCRIIHAIRAHCHKEPIETRLDKAIYACDNLAGLIVAAALVHPERRLAALTPEFVLKRFREKAFARSASREEILTCETNLDLPLETFTRIGLASLQAAADELGL